MLLIFSKRGLKRHFPPLKLYFYLPSLQTADMFEVFAAPSRALMNFYAYSHYTASHNTSHQQLITSNNLPR